MKKLISFLLIILVTGTMLTGCGKTTITDMVDRYEFRGVEDDVIYWDVYFNDDYKSSEYDYEDFIDVIEECMSRSGQYSFSNAWILAFDSDGYTNRFSWNTKENRYVITQTDGTVPNLREYEWNLTPEEVNEIWDSIGYNAVNEEETSDDVAAVESTDEAEDTGQNALAQALEDAGITEPKAVKTVTHDFNEETNQTNQNADTVWFDVPQTWEKQEVTKSGSRYYRAYLMGKDSFIVTYENTNNYGDSYKPYEDDILSSLKADYNDFTLINTSEREIFDDKVALEVTFTWKSSDKSYEDIALFFKQHAELVGFYLQSAFNSEYDRSEDFESVINSFHEWESDSSDSEEDESEITG